MAKSQFDMLVDDLAAEAALERARSKLAGQSDVRTMFTKSMPLYELMTKAGIDANNVKPFTGKAATIHEKGVKVGDHVIVKGKTAATVKPAPAAEPREHTALRVAHAIGEMKSYARGQDLNGPVTEQQLKAVHALARAGEMSQEEVADVEKALSDKRALPLYILKKLGSGNT